MIYLPRFKCVCVCGCVIFCTCLCVSAVEAVIGTLGILLKVNPKESISFVLRILHFKTKPCLVQKGSHGLQYGRTRPRLAASGVWAIGALPKIAFPR